MTDMSERNDMNPRGGAAYRYSQVCFTVRDRTDTDQGRRTL
jgi:hypothetical protein